jgi:secretion/DNA translocation related TadE-like protein
VLAARGVSAEVGSLLHGPSASMLRASPVTAGPVPEGQRGSMSLLAAAGALTVLIMAMAIADVTVALMARSRAQTAADAAALAAAQELLLPSTRDPADVASEYADRNGGSLVTCRCERDTSEAVVEIRVPIGPLLLLGGGRVVTARARAVVGA